MTLRERILALFESSKGQYLSGEEIGKALNVSRAGVWKAVKALQQEGYPIHAVPNKGYCLSRDSDILSCQGVQKYLRHDALQVQVQDKVSSTNQAVKALAQEKAPEGTAVVAGCQEAGKGRYGRSFYSPQGSGVYLSLLLRPRDWSPESSLGLTTMAAVAVCRAIEAVSGEHPQVKWVNDIYLHGKKVCGILTEGAFSMENGMLEYGIVGIGVNVYTPAGGFPPELQGIAGPVFSRTFPDGKNRLAGEILNQLMDCYQNPDPLGHLQSYRNYSMVLGKAVEVITPTGPIPATALSIDEHFRLVVRYSDGREAALSQGEVSVRPGKE